jgi:hypothetical protein
MRIAVVTDTGLIRRFATGPTPEWAALQAIKPDETVREVDETITFEHWYSGTDFVLKEPLPGTWDVNSIAADGAETATLSGLPNPTMITITGPVQNAVEVIDGSLEFSTDTPGSYTVTASAFPYLDQVTTVEAT